MSVYQIDGTHSAVEFAIKHLMISNVKGRFTKVAGELTVDGANSLNSSVEASAEIASIDTHDPQRDGHLRSPDFFDADKYPTMTFKSTEIKSIGEDRYELTGDLTIKGNTKPVTFTVTNLGEFNDPMMGHRIAYSGEGKINRRDYGMTFDMMLDGRLVVSNELKISLEGELVEAEEEQAATAEA